MSFNKFLNQVLTPTQDSPNIVERPDLPVHGSPQDRGSADRYYGRPYDPHWYPMGTGKGERIESIFMSEAQMEEYRYGWDNEEDRKVW